MRLMSLSTALMSRWRKRLQRWEIHGQFDLKDNGEFGFLDTLYMNLDTNMLKELGWNAGLAGVSANLDEMYRRMIDRWY